MSETVTSRAGVLRRGRDYKDGSAGTLARFFMAGGGKRRQRPSGECGDAGSARSGKDAVRFRAQARLDVMQSPSPVEIKGLLAPSRHWVSHYEVMSHASPS